MVAPIPCGHCGTLFMRKDLSYEAPKLCNNCEEREKKRAGGVIKSEEEDSNKIVLLIKMTKDKYAEIEEICVNGNESFSNYFLRIHELNVKHRFLIKIEEDTKEIAEIAEIPQKTNDFSIKKPKKGK